MSNIAGWDKKEGTYIRKKLSDEEIWGIFNRIFSSNTVHKTSYKYGLIKAIIDNLFNTSPEEKYKITYNQIFYMFSRNYWNLIVKYGINQIKKDSRNVKSKIEKIFNEYVEKDHLHGDLEFDCLQQEDQKCIVNLVERSCKQYVMGALHFDSGDYLYDFSNKNRELYLNPDIYEFLLKYKSQIEKINYYEWAKYLETINDDDVLLRILDKLDLATQRSNLNIYRKILENEFAQHNCFYCGKRLGKEVHVDHFIPWSFVKDDKLWNFVLSCPSCNKTKSNRIVSKDYLVRLKRRNEEIMNIQNKTEFMEMQYKHYNERVLQYMWKYAKNNGFQEIADDRLMSGSKG